MAAPIKLRHAWLRDALMDKGKRQKDLAKLWKVDEAVASRFIRTGEPTLTMDRAVLLSQMLDMDLNELQLRLAEKPLPRASSHVPPEPAATDPLDVLTELRAAVERARDSLPGWKITLDIRPDDNGDPGSPGRAVRVAFMGDNQ